MWKRSPSKCCFRAQTFLFSKSFTALLQIKQLDFQNLQAFHLGISWDSVTYTNLLKSATKSESLIHGQLVHAHMIKNCFKQNLFLQNNLLNMYCKCGDMELARRLFDRMPHQNVVSWNCLVSGYSLMGFYDMAMDAFNEARLCRIKLDKFTYSSALSVCVLTEDLKLGKLIHGLIVISGYGVGVFLTNSLIDMYAKCGPIDQARIVFDNADKLDDVSWNSMISGYVRSGLNEEMFKILVSMQQSGVKMNSFALGSVLKACCSSFHDYKKIGKMFHVCVVKLGIDSDIVIATGLLDMYAKTGNLDDATTVFKVTPNQNVVMYNAMIAGFYREERKNCEEFSSDAMNLFLEMQRKGIQPSMFTFSSILKVCNTIEAFECGKQLHAQILKNNFQSDEFIGSELVEMYSMSGLVKEGLKCFESTPMLDIVSWTSMISGYVQNYEFESALSMYYELLASQMKPDKFTISNVLSACAYLAAARSGEQIQGYALKTGIGNSTIVQNSQIFMYAKSGDIDSADLTFKEIEKRDVVSWSAMISSHALHGCARESVSLFEAMKHCGIAPNDVTFLGVLTACSHGGLIDEGFRYFESMKKDHGITPNLRHCVCIVDLLGRAGRLSDADSFILNSGFEHDPVIWKALLGACRVHGNTKIGKHVAEQVIELEPQAASSYVLLYNIYSDAGIELPALEVRDLMKSRGVKKEPGLSWIEIRGTVHSFVVGDQSHHNSQMIYARLEEMLEKIKKMGYVDEKSVSDVSKQVHKERSYHSEKLAVTLGIISLPKSAPVRVMKNLRVCVDCHTTMKLFSELEKREIILRDPLRFHRFRDGSCSCRDYW